MTLEKILLSDDVVKSINDNLDYMLIKIPEIEYMMGFDQNHPNHHLDVWNHTLLALSLSEKDFDVRLTLLLHDIGKPFSYQDREVRHFKNHPKVSAIMTKDILTRLGYSDSYVEYITKLVKNHDKGIDKKLIEEDRLFCLKLYKIQRCDILAHNPKKLEKGISYLNNINKELKIKR